MVNLVAAFALLKIIKELIRLFAVHTNSVIELFKRTPQTQLKILRNLPPIIVPLNHQLLIHFLLLLLQRRTITLTGITATPLGPTYRTNTMLIALGGATVVLHTNFTVEDNVRVPVMMIAEVLLDGVLECLDDLLDLEQVLNCWGFLCYLKFQHSWSKDILQQVTGTENKWLLLPIVDRQQFLSFQRLFRTLYLDNWIFWAIV